MFEKKRLQTLGLNPEECREFYTRSCIGQIALLLDHNFPAWWNMENVMSGILTQKNLREQLLEKQVDIAGVLGLTDAEIDLCFTLSPVVNEAWIGEAFKRSSLSFFKDPLNFGEKFYERRT